MGSRKISKAVLSPCFDDLAALVQIVECGSDKPFVGENLCPVFAAEVGREHDTQAFVRIGYHVEKQFGYGLFSQNLPEFI